MEFGLMHLNVNNSKHTFLVFDCSWRQTARHKTQSVRQDGTNGGVEL